jgi:hypothetical protein
MRWKKYVFWSLINFKNGGWELFISIADVVHYDFEQV